MQAQNPNQGLNSQQKSQSLKQDQLLLDSIPNLQTTKPPSPPQPQSIYEQQTQQPDPQSNEPQQYQPLEGYVISKTLGKGNFGKVKLALHKLTQQLVAVKILEKDLIFQNTDIVRITRQLKIMKKLRHPFVVQLYQIIQTPKQLYLIMEYAQGGDLFDKIVNQQKIKENQAALIFTQLSLGMEYFHSKGVTHRDLKPQNILLSKDGTIKIADFGLGNMFKPDEKLKTACGSPCYASPQMLNRQPYDPKKIDIWSAGIILYALVCGYLPFEDQVTSKLYEKIKTTNVKLPSWVSSPCRNLIRGLLTKDPKLRFDIDSILTHQMILPFVQEYREVVKERQLTENKIQEICEMYDIEEREKLVSDLNKNRHNNLTTLYYLGVRRIERQQKQGNQDEEEHLRMENMKVKGNKQQEKGKQQEEKVQDLTGIEHEHMQVLKVQQVSKMQTQEHVQSQVNDKQEKSQINSKQSMQIQPQQKQKEQLDPQDNKTNTPAKHQEQRMMQQVNEQQVNCRQAIMQSGVRSMNTDKELSDGQLQIHKLHHDITIEIELPLFGKQPLVSHNSKYNQEIINIQNDKQMINEIDPDYFEDQDEYIQQKDLQKNMVEYPQEQHSMDIENRINFDQRNNINFDQKAVQDKHNTIKTEQDQRLNQYNEQGTKEQATNGFQNGFEQNNKIWQKEEDQAKLIEESYQLSIQIQNTLAQLTQFQQTNEQQLQQQQDKSEYKHPQQKQQPQNPVYSAKQHHQSYDNIERPSDDNQQNIQRLQDDKQQNTERLQDDDLQNPPQMVWQQNASNDIQQQQSKQQQQDTQEKVQLPPQTIDQGQPIHDQSEDIEVNQVKIVSHQHQYQHQSQTNNNIQQLKLTEALLTEQQAPPQQSALNNQNNFINSHQSQTQPYQDHTFTPQNHQQLPTHPQQLPNQHEQSQTSLQNYIHPYLIPQNQSNHIKIIPFTHQQTNLQQITDYEHQKSPQLSISNISQLQTPQIPPQPIILPLSPQKKPTQKINNELKPQKQPKSIMIKKQEKPTKTPVESPIKKSNKLKQSPQPQYTEPIKQLKPTKLSRQPQNRQHLFSNDKTLSKPIQKISPTQQYKQPQLAQQSQSPKAQIPNAKPLNRNIKLNQRSQSKDSPIVFKSNKNPNKLSEILKNNNTIQKQQSQQQIYKEQSQQQSPRPKQIKQKFSMINNSHKTNVNSIVQRQKSNSKEKDISSTQNIKNGRDKITIATKQKGSVVREKFQIAKKVQSKIYPKLNTSSSSTKNKSESMDKRQKQQKLVQQFRQINEPITQQPQRSLQKILQKPKSKTSIQLTNNGSGKKQHKNFSDRFRKTAQQPRHQPTIHKQHQQIPISPVSGHYKGFFSVGQVKDGYNQVTKQQVQSQRIQRLKDSQYSFREQHHRNRTQNNNTITAQTTYNQNRSTISYSSKQKPGKFSKPMQTSTMNYNPKTRTKIAISQYSTINQKPSTLTNNQQTPKNNQQTSNNKPGTPKNSSSTSFISNKFYQPKAKYSNIYQAKASGNSKSKDHMMNNTISYHASNKNDKSSNINDNTYRNTQQQSQLDSPLKSQHSRMSATSNSRQFQRIDIDNMNPKNLNENMLNITFIHEQPTLINYQLIVFFGGRDLYRIVQELSKTSGNSMNIQGRLTVYEYPTKDYLYVIKSDLSGSALGQASDSQSMSKTFSLSGNYKSSSDQYSSLSMKSKPKTNQKTIKITSFEFVQLINSILLENDQQ